MIENDDKAAKEIDALSLIDRAENLADDGKGNESIELYEKAAQIYMDLGSYIKLDELYIRIARIISHFKNNIQALYRLKSIIRKTEQLQLYEISAKLLIQLGNLALVMKDWETAGESWTQASDYLFEIDPDEYYKTSSELLLRAGQALEKTKQRRDEGERLILKAVMTVNQFDELYKMEEQRALNLIAMKQYEPSSNKYSEISQFFLKAIKHLEELSPDFESKDVYTNAKARLLHLEAEYLYVAALCLRAAQDRKYNAKIKEFGNSVLIILKDAIELLKNHASSVVGELDKEHILRLTFDVFLLSATQNMLGKKEIDPIEFLIRGLEHKGTINKIKNSPFYKLTERVEKVGVLESLEQIKKIHLGHIEKVKQILIPFFI